MDSKNFTMIYEEPSTLFDEGPWAEFREFMLREVELHPDWPEAAFSLQSANEHLAWIKDRSFWPPDAPVVSYGIIKSGACSTPEAQKYFDKYVAGMPPQAA